MPWLTVTEATSRYDISPEHLRRLLRDGTLKAQRVGPLWQVDQRSLEAYLVVEQKTGRPRKKR